jgi:hypothetical protein
MMPALSQVARPQIADAAIDHAFDQRLGISRQAEAADHDRHAVAQRHECLFDR